jgi:hypothetical protein
MRINCLIDILLPHCTKSRIDAEDPNRPIDLSDIVLPSSIISRIDMSEPMRI